MTASDGGSGVNPLGTFRLDGLWEMVLDQAEELDRQFNGVSRDELVAELRLLQADALALVDYCSGGKSYTFRLLDASDGTATEICLEATSYRFFFLRPSDASSWYELAYLMRRQR